MTTRLLLSLALLAYPLAPAGAQRAEPATVTWLPARPTQGTLVRLTVVPRGADPAIAVRGTLAGEPLHFARDSAGRFRALGGIPVDAADTLVVSLAVERRSSVVDSVTVPVAVAPGAFRLERLRVAPRFGREPDSALARRLETEAARAAEVSRRAHDTPRLWRTPFARPRPGRVTSGFGNGREFNGQVQSRHMGTDLAGAGGAPIRAMNRGVVALVDTFYLGGRVVYLDHGAGLVSAYLHMSRQQVAVGDTVDAGQVIGRVGATGRVTGPHLHWIVRYGGVTVNPMSVFEP